MDKILKSYTIIPSHLYVEREADRQIKSIIEHMERPGYVLVSRQMGKTNLLLNAKRELEGANDIYIYIDLSNRFDDVNSCFQNIIDNILEVYEDRLPDAKIKIAEHRKIGSSLSPHRQHINELRIILKSISGKVVVILDEIDALTKTEYSDLIFSQIRSVYFTRVNFAELSRLTYILSGVIEPNEIIKDPKISPFNIGEKIFLNDFSYSEFRAFITQSKLNFAEEIIERVYYWTNGNPRMTWDLCSEVENWSIHNGYLRDDAVDEVVAETYFKSYDKPPIDNIREMVQNDQELRNSLIEIYYKKGGQISDKLKSKLYLSGIINYSKNDVDIKNNIIKEALNINWVKSLEEDKSLLDIALTYFKKENYQEAAFYFENYLQDNVFEGKDNALFYHYMGVCYFMQGNYKKAIETFKMAVFDLAENPKFFYYNIDYVARALFILEEYAESLNNFEKVIQDNTLKDATYIQAKINYAAIKSAHIDIENFEESKAILLDVINEKETRKLNASILRDAKTNAYYNLATLCLSKNKVSESETYLLEAIKVASSDKLIALYLEILALKTSDIEKEVTLGIILDLLLSNNLLFLDYDKQKPLVFNKNHVKNIFYHSYVLHQDKAYEKILPLLNATQGEPVRILFQTAYSLISENRFSTALFALYDIINKTENKDNIHFLSRRLIAYVHSCNNENFNFIENYISELILNKDLSIERTDVILITNACWNLSLLGFDNQVIDFTKKVEHLRFRLDANLEANFIVLYNYYLQACYNLDKRSEAVNAAYQILDLFKQIEDTKNKTTLWFDTKHLSIVKSNALGSIKQKNQVMIEVENSKDLKIGRNEIITVKYTSGKITTAKYKHVEKDITDRLCTII